MFNPSTPAARLPRVAHPTLRWSALLLGLGWFLAAGAARATPLISEFMASNHGTLADDDGDFPDWIELYNPEAQPIALTGWYLTDNAAKKTKWQFPAVTLAARGYLVVFASGKDRRDPAKPLHTGFSLDIDGGYLGLIKPDGVTVASDFAPAYPAQVADLSYGLTQPPANSVEAPQLGYFGRPTPGAPNGGAASLILPARVSFSVPAGPVARDTTLALSGAGAGEVIRYTLVPPSADGAVADEPTSSSPVYSTPLALTGSALIRAAVFLADGSRRGCSTVAHFTRVDASLADFASELPVVVLDTHGAGALNANEPARAAWFHLLAPAGPDGTFAEPPLASAAATARVRGASSANFPKKSYAVTLLDDRGQHDARPLLGLASDDTWDLISPWFYDRAFFRNAYIYSLSRSLGRWAPRTKFVEVFCCGDATALDGGDYAGLSMLTERITVDPQHVNLTPLSLAATTLPDISGGYILKVDVAGPDDFSFTTPHMASWSPQTNLSVYRPSADALPPAQRDYIRGYVSAMENALYADAANGWASHTHLAYLDRASWVDYHLLQVLSGNVDALIRSTYFTKERNGKLVAGPLWDFDRSLGSSDHRNGAWDQWNSPDAADYWNFGWWGVLARDPEFMQAWIDRWQQLRRSELSAPQLAATADQLAAQIGPDAAARDAARWPDNTSHFATGWTGEVDSLKSWVTNRANWIDQQFVAPPTLETDGLLLVATPPPGAQLVYTLNGVDPRGPNGQLGLSAQITSAPLVVSAGTLLVARAWNAAKNSFPGSPWSAPVARTDARRVNAVSGTAGSDARLANLSSLVHVGPGEGAPLTGLVITGGAEKYFLVRSVGPGLRQFGMGDALADPVLRILDTTGREIFRNAGWTLGGNATDIRRVASDVGAFQLPDASADAALLVHLAPGTYTLLVESAANRAGAVLTEIYELDRTGTLASLSTVATVNAAHPVLFGGFIVRGTAPKKFLVRAVGPALGALGVRGTLADPLLTLYREAGAGVAARNDDWLVPATSDDADSTAIAAAAVACGSFALPAGGKDAAVLVALAPGAYTAQVTGKPGDSGLVLLEIYGVP